MRRRELSDRDRQGIIDALRAGLSYAEIKKRFRVSTKTLWRIKNVMAFEDRRTKASTEWTEPNLSN